MLARTITSPLVGRSVERARLSSLLAAGERLVTIIGPGGVGKTRLALAMIEAGEASTLVELAEARSAIDVLAALGRALGVDFGSATETASMIAAIARAASGVIVLDDCEGGVEAIASVVRRLREAAPEVSFLATSRERLQLRDEQVFELEPLPIMTESVELLLACARRRDHAFSPSEAERADIEGLARDLEGLPLALELAAALLDVMPAATLLRRLGERLDLLRTDERDRSPRHRSLRATLEWSWSLLADREQRALARLSVFRGGFTLEAIAAVVGDDAPSVTRALRDRSLLQRSRDDRRFELLEAVRAFAAERLRDSGDEERTVRAHAAYYAAHGLALARRWAASLARDAFEALALERANLLAAHERALERADDDALIADGCRAMEALASLFIVRGPLATYLARLDGTLAAAGERSPELVSSLFARRAYARQMVNDDEGSLRDLAEALAIARRSGERTAEVVALRLLGVRARNLGLVAEARRHTEEAVTVARAAEDTKGLALSLLNLAQLDHADGQCERALSVLVEVEIAERALGSSPTAGLAAHTAAAVLQELGRHDEARVRHDEAVRVARDIDHRHYLGWFVGARAQLDHEAGDLPRAIAGYREALACFAALGDRASDPTFRAPLAVALAEQGDHAAADRELARAEAAAVEHLARACRIHRAILALVREGTTIAERCASGASEEERFATRLAAQVARRTAAPRLAIGREHARLRAPDGRVVDLASAPALRRLVSALVEARLARPGVAVCTMELLRAGWPGEKIRADAAKNRLRVAVSRLRKQGLARILLSGDGGYWLDPRVRIVNEDC